MEFDAILIPGGGVFSKGKLPLWVIRRLDFVINNYRGELILTLSAGTTHKPPILDDNNYVIFESIAAANYLREKGIPRSKILTETASYDTIGNAYFARFIHTDILGLKRLLIVTSDFHLPRVKSIFNWVFNLESPFQYELHFQGVSDSGIEKNILQSRIEKERESLANFNRLKGEITTLKDFHKWLFFNHKAYSVGSQEKTISLGNKFQMY